MRMWNFSSPGHTDRHSHSILANLDSISVRDILARATGHLFYVRTVPNPYSLASVWMLTGCSLLK